VLALGLKSVNIAYAWWRVIKFIHADSSRKHGDTWTFREISDQQILCSSDHHGLFTVWSYLPLAQKVRFSIWFRRWGHNVWFGLVLSERIFVGSTCYILVKCLKVRLYELNYVTSWLTLRCTFSLIKFRQRQNFLQRIKWKLNAMYLS
jgi:hypothetical protein